MAYPYLSQIARACIDEESRYVAAASSLAQVSDIRLVCERDGRRFYAVSGTVFAKLSAFQKFWVAAVSEEGDLWVTPESSLVNARIACRMASDQYAKEMAS